MRDLLPDLTGRSDWVVIVVVALLVAGAVGLKWVARNSREVDTQDDEDGDRPPIDVERAGLPASDGHTALVLTKALDLLAAEAVESQGARAEVDQLRERLQACQAEHDRVAQNFVKAQADLEQCNQTCRKLAMRALELGGDSSE